MTIDPDIFDRTRRNAVQQLLAARSPEGHWVGELSSSALSTATAIVALHLIDQGAGTEIHSAAVRAGADWLIAHQNPDGGWGDTTRSHSNISTTTLCWAALGLIAPEHAANANAQQWLEQAAGSVEPAPLAQAIMQRYGKDRTFSVPILMMAALCGRLGPANDRATWRWVQSLPFELATIPAKWFHRVNLRVVSYALPALIAIGQLRHHRRPSRNPVARLIRQMALKRTRRLLEKIQPENGGFLEATPLTSFVTMALAGADRHDHPVAEKGAAFLVQSMRPDGSWPIDTNLATWVTTLSINALAAGGALETHLDDDARSTLRQWLLKQQYTQVHPYTNAEPGGWAWTDLPGGVPDADDTSGAILALHHLDDASPAVRHAVESGLQWLARMQNRDGGMPTFCRGWGRLPFDRSSQDITAHFLRAAKAWRFTSGTEAANQYLQQTQAPDGSWTPLWFGNQDHAREENPTYGTTRVMIAMPTAARDRPTAWLIAHQNPDGGWGAGPDTPSTLEETALAIESLAACQTDDAQTAIDRGLSWLAAHTREGTQFEPAPIGFYFAKLWYFEKLYPLIFTVGALERCRSRFESPSRKRD